MKYIKQKIITTILAIIASVSFPILWYDYLVHILTTPQGKLSMLEVTPFALWVIVVLCLWSLTVTFWWGD